MKERTLRNPAFISGVGVHSGKEVSVTLTPRKEGGITFMKDGFYIPGDIEYVENTDRGINLKKDDIEVRTVEHLLAALYGCMIDHLLIEVNGEEIPAIDGSAYPFIELMKNTGFAELERERKSIYVDKSFLVEGKGCFAMVSPCDELEIRYLISYKNPILSFQEFIFNKDSNFFEDIAKARTYGMLSWKEKLQESGYALGASEENTLIFDDYRILNEPRYPDEPVRHKILDLFGDLYLIKPVPIGRYLVVRGGHKLHYDLLKRLKKELNWNSQ